MHESGNRTRVTFHVTISEDSDGSYWAKVDELPGCFASGFSVEEVLDAAFDAMQLWLPDGITLGDPTWERIDEAKTPSRSAQTHNRPRHHPKRQRLVLCA